MRNKGLFKAFFTPSFHFIWGKATPVSISAEFTLSQCRIGWCKCWNNIQIHLLFVDVIIYYLPLDTREHAREYIKGAKEDEKMLKQSKKDVKKMNLWKLIPHRHIYRLGDYGGKRCRRCGKFRKLEQKD